MQATTPNEFAGSSGPGCTTAGENFWVLKYPDATFADFKRKRIGNKEYGFLHYSNPNTFVARYKCSWVEADRQFKMLLITGRMMK